MNDNEQKVARRIQELEGAVRKARLEAMQLGAQLLTKSNALLSGAPAGSNASTASREVELAALRARYEGLVKVADDAQALIDNLQAQEHERKYHR